MNKAGSVLIVGGGIAGMQSALDLANSGYKVYLVESKPGIGGTMSQLDKTFPTNDCSICILSPKLVETGRHRNIEVITNAEIKSVEGKGGLFKITIREKPRYIDPYKCTGCGLCSKYCPVEAVDSYNEKLSKRAAIYIQYPQSVPLAYIIDKDKCVGCGLCKNICLADAIDYEDKGKDIELDVGAVILSPGFDEFNPKIKAEYGYGVYPNVVTSIEFERILSASGPYQGHVLRPSDSKIPDNIAFIQCVGSREVRKGNPYCSSVCCMYAVKEAVIATEHTGGVKCTMFYMDLRTFGKDFDKYVNRAKKEYGVRMIRSRVASLKEDKDRNLIIAYEAEDGRLIKEKFELVVLSVGFDSPSGIKEVAEKFGVKLNKYNFAQTSVFEPIKTNVEGIFVAGAFASPKDIPETVAEASGAASEAMAYLKEVRGKEVREKIYPPVINVNNEPPRIGVFVCHCGINIGGYLDVKAVTDYASTLPGVVHAEDNMYTCSQDTQEKMQAVIEKYKLNRVIVASCTPRTHEPLFQETIREAGLNRYLFEMANIRDQDSWVHMNLFGLATSKAKDLVRMTVYKARLLEPLKEFKIPVNKNALIIGGGITGMNAALSLSDMGYTTYIIERDEKLGGNARNITETTGGEDVQNYLKELVKKIENKENIKVLKGAEIDRVEGYVGNYKTFLKGIDKPIEHGAVIIATGAKEYVPTEYSYGKSKRILLQRELENKIANNEIKGTESVVMIQCVGSRDENHPWCSRICCSRAVKNAIDLAQKGIQTFILYRDIRTYGFREGLYTKARELGVVFVRFDENNKPTVSLDENGGISINVYDAVLRLKLQIKPDYLVLSNGIVPDKENNEQIAKLFKVPLNEDGFFLEAHMKLRPVDFATDGVFLAGLAHSPKFVNEAIAQAKAAAGRAAIILARDYILTAGTVSHVDEQKCIGCGLCTSVCPYAAVSLVEKKVMGKIKTIAEVNPVLCKGCGACAATCRPGAIDLFGFSNSEIINAEFGLISEQRKVETLDMAKKILSEV